jgi:hypothetical protein
MIAGSHAYLKVMAPSMDLWDVILPKGYRGVFHEDNQAMIRVVQTGRNPTMRHLDRVHRVSIATLHERLGDPETKDNIDMIYTKSIDMSADIYTKAFTDAEAWAHALLNINIVQKTETWGYADFIKKRVALMKASTEIVPDETVQLAGG